MPRVKSKKADNPLMTSGRQWDWAAVMNLVAERLSAAALLTVAEVLQEPYVDEDGKEWPLPDRYSFSRALRNHPELAKQVYDARGDGLVEASMNIISDLPHAETSVNVQAANVALSHIRWLSGIFNDRYNPKTRVDHSGKVEAEFDWSKVFGSGPPTPRGNGE